MIFFNQFNEYIYIYIFLKIQNIGKWVQAGCYFCTNTVTQIVVAHPSIKLRVYERILIFYIMNPF
jgi:hypothetical protein